MEKLISEINDRLLQIIDRFQDSTVKEAMRYSLMAGGKQDSAGDDAANN